MFCSSKPPLPLCPDFVSVLCFLLVFSSQHLAASLTPPQSQPLRENPLTNPWSTAFPFHTLPARSSPPAEATAVAWPSSRSHPVSTTPAPQGRATWHTSWTVKRVRSRWWSAPTRSPPAPNSSSVTAAPRATSTRATASAASAEGASTL
jgi:hypothetical protein